MPLTCAWKPGQDSARLAGKPIARPVLQIHALEAGKQFWHISFAG
jgi:hypothetical protein